MNPLALKEMALKLRELNESAKEKYQDGELMNYSEDSKAFLKWKEELSTKLTEIYNFAKNNNIPCKVEFNDLLEEIESRIKTEVENEYYEEYSEEISNDYDED